MTRGNQQRLNCMAIGIALGAIAYHVSLTRPWARGAGRAR